MAEPFLSEIRIVSFNFPPKGWAFCNGQFLPINQNQALFALLGTTYGGNGQTTFALPNLQGRAPMHEGSGHVLGEAGGEQAHTVTLSEMPMHTHALQATSDVADAVLTTNNLLAQTIGTFGSAYAPAANLTPMAAQAITNVGGSQPHANMHPYLVLTFIIALQGIFPSRN
ncbi:MAG TPA: tail fiber protein [Actinomycetota bacterium]|nr:tail fiber protein [Actinomycetota bacterium]